MDTNYVIDFAYTASFYISIYQTSNILNHWGTLLEILIHTHSLSLSLNKQIQLTYKLEKELLFPAGQHFPKHKEYIKFLKTFCT